MCFVKYIIAGEFGNCAFVDRDYILASVHDTVFAIGEGKMASARVVANRLLNVAAANGEGLTPMQVLKLVYIAHGWSLALYGRPLIDQEVEAWQYGPVIPDLYRAMRNFRNERVHGPLDLGWGGHAQDLSDDETKLVDQVYGLYGHMGGIALSRITHAPGTPWAQTHTPGRFGTIIPDEMIAGHYVRLKNERTPAAK